MRRYPFRRSRRCPVVTSTDAITGPTRTSVSATASVYFDWTAATMRSICVREARSGRSHRRYRLRARKSDAGVRVRVAVAFQIVSLRASVVVTTQRNALSLKLLFLRRQLQPFLQDCRRAWL